MRVKCLDFSGWSCYCLQIELNCFEVFYVNIFQEEFQLFNGIGYFCCIGGRFSLVFILGF